MFSARRRHTCEHQLDTVDTLNARKFHIAIRRLADNLAYGTDSSMYVGSGTEYSQSRPYQPGDPVKSIDWRITARTRKFFVKEYETPKRMPCYLLIDTSASMTVGSTRPTKYGLGVQIAGGLALACLDRISPVAVMGVGERELRYTPSLSRDRILEWMHALRTYRLDESTSIAERLQELGPILSNRVLLIVISDLHQPEAIQPLKRMAQQHDVVAIQMLDPAERELRGAGFVRGVEAETGRPFVTRGRMMGGFQDWLVAELKRARVDHLVLPVNESPLNRMRHFFKARGLLGKGVR
jgi:uncharacterized protein (DUF58 family)